MKIIVGDTIKVLAGKDRGKTGKVIQVFNKKENGQRYVVVEKINMLKKHMRASGQQKGQIIELPAPIHASNVQLIDPKSSKPTRVGYMIEGGEKKRIAKKSGLPLTS